VASAAGFFAAFGAAGAICFGTAAAFTAVLGFEALFFGGLFVAEAGFVAGTAFWAAAFLVAMFDSCAVG